jgi:hypothetical protein
VNANELAELLGAMRAEDRRRNVVASREDRLDEVIFTEGAYVAIERVAGRVADHLAATDPGFDRIAFMRIVHGGAP